MSFRWPALDGWGEETIPFPLPFAPGLAYKGTEVLRFMPGWARSGEPDHWSYVFAWWLEQAAPAGEQALIEDLVAYYEGLCAAVSGDAQTYDPDGFRVRLAATGERVRDGHHARQFEGTAALYDAFGSGEPMTLHLHIEAWECPDAGTSVVLIEAAPTRDDAIWRRLAAQAHELACH